MVLLVSVVQAETITFQNGVDGYTSTQDARISWWAGHQDGTTNFGDDDHFWILGTIGYGGNENAALIRFDDIFGTGKIDVASASHISSATLRIYCLAIGSNGGKNPIFRQMKTSWSESDVTYSYRAYNGSPTAYWGTSSTAETGPVVDDDYYVPDTYYGGTPTPGQWLQVDIRSVVQDWCAGTANEGVYGMVNGTTLTGGYKYASSEYATVEYRPQLVVEFDTTPDVWDPCVPENTAVFKQGYKVENGRTDLRCG